MYYDQESQLSAEPQQDKPILLLGMIRIVLHSGILVSKCRGGLAERDAMLTLVVSVLPVVPRKGYPIHNDIVMTLA